MTLFTVSAILLLDTVSALAAIGVSSITWWCVLALNWVVILIATLSPGIGKWVHNVGAMLKLKALVMILWAESENRTVQHA